MLTGQPDVIEQLMSREAPMSKTLTLIYSAVVPSMRHITVGVLSVRETHHGRRTRNERSRTKARA